jgi:hypothetical protein
MLWRDKAIAARAVLRLEVVATVAVEGAGAVAEGRRSALFCNGKMDDQTEIYFGHFFGRYVQRGIF